VSPDNIAMGECVLISGAQRDMACVRGLTSALARKVVPAYVSEDCWLRVYCEGFGFQTIDGEFPGIVKAAAASVSKPAFQRVFAFHERLEGGDGFQEMTSLEWRV